MSVQPSPIARLSPKKQELLLRHLAAKRLAREEDAIRPRPAGTDRFPLSDAQRRLWFLDFLQPGNVAYNVYEGLRLRGALDGAALVSALAEIVRRHHVLRARFELEDGAPVQVIPPYRGPALAVAELSALPCAAAAAELRRLATAEGARPFDLARGPLHRFLLLRLGTADHALLLALHHIASDAWSMEILFGELRALYRSFAAGLPSPLPELPVQYTDFAAWQSEWLQGERLERQLAYWRRRLAEAPASILLPLDRPRPRVQTFAGARHPLALPAQRVGPLIELAQRQGATPFMALLAVFAALLHRYTGQEDLLVGSPIANRSRPEVERVIGFFVNTLVLRLDFDGRPGFHTLLGQVRETTLGAFSHADLPFERIVEEVQPQRDAGRPPLLQVLFALLASAPQAAAELASGLTVGRVGIPNPSAKFDLNATLLSTADRLSGAIEYNTDLFDATTVARLAGHFERLVESAAAAPQTAVADLAWLAAAERHQLLREWNDSPPARSEPGTLGARFAAQARRTPEARAVVHEGEALTFRQLDARANRLARALRRMGVGPESTVGIHMERCLDMVVAVLGVLKAGGAYLPLDLRFPAERLAFMVEDSGAAVVLSPARRRPALPPTAARVVCLDAEEGRVAVGRESPEEPPPAAQPENVAYVIYTSGSTGRPKGVAVEHRQALAYVGAVVSRLGLPAGASYAMVQPLAVDSCKTVLYPPLLIGGCLHLISEGRAADPAALGDYLAEHAVDVLKIAPSHLAALQTAARPERLLPRRFLVIGGEASRREWAERLHPLAPGCAVFNHYGPTETTVGVLTFPLPEQPRHATLTVPLGRPLDDARCHVLDGGRQPAPVGVAGELYIGGACVARGYLGRVELTAERFVPDPFAAAPGERLYRTGDLVRRLADGTFEFLGRLDDQVKIRGFRIEPGEIESLLALHPGVAAAAVVARSDGAGEARLVAYVVAAAGEAASAAGELAAYLRARLPDYMVPTALVFLDELPRTLHGKLDRSALPAPEPAGDHRREAPRLPRDVVELELVRLWEELLGVRPVGVQDDFFALGGHSLLAVRLITRIERRFGRNLLSQLFAEATVEALARALRRGGAAAARSPLVEIQPGDGAGRPLFLVHPAGGTVFCYLPLACALGGEQAVYGLQDPRVYGSGEPCLAVGDMAALYLEALRAAQPRGPYRLGGWSLGGVVAQEMARLLEDAGEEVDILFLIDARSPGRTGGEAMSEEELLLWFAAQLAVPLSADELAAQPPERRFRFVFERAQAAGRLLADLEPLQARRIFDLYVAEMSAVSSHRPRPCRARTLLLRAADGVRAETASGEDRDLGWGGLTGGEPEIAVVPGAHTTLLDEPHVGALAAAIRAALGAEPRIEEGR